MNTHLTQRQRDVLERIADGQSNPQIASDLGIGFETVKMHVSDILHELGVESREEAADWWRRENHTIARVRRAASSRLARAFGLGLAGTAAIAAIVVGVVAFSSPENEPPPALEDLVAAMTREGHVSTRRYAEKLRIAMNRSSYGSMQQRWQAGLNLDLTQSIPRRRFTTSRE